VLVDSGADGTVALKLSNDDSHLILYWVSASALAALLAMGFLSAAYVDGSYVPVGNDAFYHALRIIDAAGSRGFYQFDSTIHVPEGSLLTWPWAYDYLMSRVLAIALWLNPVVEPMSVLAYVPVVFAVVNLGLFVLIGRAIGLRPVYAGLGVVALALSPLTQGLHGVGAVDHHFIELSFVLLTTWLGLLFFRNSASIAVAVGLGGALGVAPAFHNSLFILQFPLLLAAGICWMRKFSLSGRGAAILAASLVIACLVALIPSLPFRTLRFEFATHSWFHLYVAVVSATVIVLLTRIDFSLRRLAFVAGLTLVLALPLGIEISKGADLLSGSTVLLDQIAEVRSPFDMFWSDGGPLSATRYYSWLIVLAPALAGFCLVSLWWIANPSQIFLNCAAAFGISLMLAQFRFHPFGYWALLAAGLAFLQMAEGSFGKQARWVPAVAAVVFVAAYWPPLGHQLFQRFPPGLTPEYAVTRPLYLKLHDVCLDDPGIVLAATDDGHPIRYHSDCSVIANNFLLTRLHGEKVLEAERLLSMSPEELRAAPPGVRYVLVRLNNLLMREAGTYRASTPQELAAANKPLFNALSEKAIPEGYELVAELRTQDDRDIPYARLLRVVD